MQRFMVFAKGFRILGGFSSMFVRPYGCLMGSLFMGVYDTGFSRSRRIWVYIVLQ